MTSRTLGRALPLAAIAMLAIGASSASVSAVERQQQLAANTAPAPTQTLGAPAGSGIVLNQGVTEAAAVYVAFVKEVGSIKAGFSDAESIQAAIRKGAAYEPGQLSRGMIAYGAILALQSPEFIQGVRTFANDPQQRAMMINLINQDSAYAAGIPGAEAAAGVIVSTMGTDIAALHTIAEAVEGDAYKIQERTDPRRAWATVPIANRDVRLARAKSLSAERMNHSNEEAARLMQAATTGQGIAVQAPKIAPPYTQPVVNSLAIAALAVLGAAGDDNRAKTEALSVESNSEFCLNMSKLNLFQCLAASRPSYEDMFCVGRHIVRDLSQCAAQNTRPAPPPAPTETQVAATPAPAATAAAAQATGAN